MIKITRLPKPAHLQQNEEQWTEELCAARRQYYQELEDYIHGRRTSKPNKPDAINSRYAHQDIRITLETMFGPKCAYCESPVTAVSPQHVEHFRPKSIYPRLAYDWHNLLLACPQCNSGHKKAQFPMLDGSQPSEDSANPCRRDDSDENALIDPCRDEPTEFFDYNDEWLVCLGEDLRATQTRDVCGLNRDDLRGERKKLIRQIELICKTFLLAKQREDLEIQKNLVDYLKESIKASANYAAMSRAKLTQMGITLADLQ